MTDFLSGETERKTHVPQGIVTGAMGTLSLHRVLYNPLRLDQIGGTNN